MPSVWLCTLNGVFGPGTGWPNILVAVVMGILGLTAAKSVTARVRKEMQPPLAPAR